MVFFNCNACGEALKKNQVDKHCQRCRHCEVLSCVDCGKDFWGDDYKNHTKCMTEEEKYCGKGYVPKVNKGEAKQEEWIEKVQSAISKASKNPQVSQLLERIKDYPNIPRKRAKFENFLKNSLRIHNNYLINEVWELLMTAANKVKEEASTNVSDQHKSDAQNVEEKENKNGLIVGKRQKKEERRKKTHKKEKKDKMTNPGETEETVKTKKKKKRKHDECEESQDPSDEAPADSPDLVQRKQKKGKDSPGLHSLNGDTEESISNNTVVEEGEDEEDETPKKKRRKVKFNWESVIMTVLKSKGEMSLKKLRKKVLAEFAAQDASNFNEENLNAKFGKKIVKIPSVKVSKDRVSLKANKKKL